MSPHHPVRRESKLHSPASIRMSLALKCPRAHALPTVHMLPYISVHVAGERGGAWTCLELGGDPNSHLMRWNLQFRAQRRLWTGGGGGGGGQQTQGGNLLAPAVNVAVTAAVSSCTLSMRTMDGHQ